MPRRIVDQHFLSAAALILPLLGFLAPLGIAPLLTVVAIGLIAIDPGSRLRLSRPFFPLAIILGLLSLWAGLSAAWSTVPQHSLFEAGRLVLLSASGIIVVSAGLATDRAGAARIGRAGLIGLALGVIAASIEFFGDFPIHRAFSNVADRLYYFSVLDRGAVVLALTCWIAIRHSMLQRRPVVAVLVFALALLTVARLVSLSALLGFLLAACVFALAWWRPRAVAVMVIAGFTLLTAALPLIHPTRTFIIWLSEATPWLRTSALHRLIIWRFASDRIAEHPILGWGMDASRALPQGSMDVRDYLHLPPDFLYGNFNGAVMPLHPHDAILQWWLELGALGALLGLATIAWTVWHAAVSGTPPRAVRAAALAMIAAAVPPLLFDFGVWQAWWQSALWFAAAFATTAWQPSKPGG